MLPSMFTIGLDPEGAHSVHHPVWAELVGWLGACKVLLGMADKARQGWMRLKACRVQALAHPYLAQLHNASSEPAAPSAPAAYKQALELALPCAACQRSCSPGISCALKMDLLANGFCMWQASPVEQDSEGVHSSVQAALHSTLRSRSWMRPRCARTCGPRWRATRRPRPPSCPRPGSLHGAVVSMEKGNRCRV